MSVSEANRKFFDSISSHYDSKPFFKVVDQAITDTLRGRIDWLGLDLVGTNSKSSGRDVRLLDYACGTGMMTRVYGPYVSVTRGLDVSPNMVATYNARARAAGVAETSIKAAVGDLLDKAAPAGDELATPEWNNFDLATVGFGFHHFEDPVHAAKQLKQRLRPGGVLVLTDFLEGGDMKADENGDPIPGTEGNHAVHTHNHGNHNHQEEGQKPEPGHRHAHEQKHEHNHHGHDHDTSPSQPSGETVDEFSASWREKMEASVVVPHFGLGHVKAILVHAGFVDVDVFAREERVYLEFGGLRLWRKILFAKGRRPEDGKSEL